MIDALKMTGAPPAPEPMARGFGSFAALSESVDFAVQPAAVAAVEPLTLEQAKTHLRVYLNDEDDYIAGLIIAARMMAEGRLNRTITQRQLVATFRAWHVGMRLPKPPVVSVDAVEYLDTDGALQPFDSFDVLAEGMIGPTYGATLPAIRHRPDAIRVTYTAGYAEGEVPAPIVQWMLLAIGTMYQNRESIINGVSSQPLAGDFFAMLLQPYMVYE